MQDLRLIGVHEDGLHLLLAGADGERFRVPLDDALRAAARRDRPHLGQLQIEIDGGLRPRDVQAMVRGGASAEEVAERSGWSVEKVRKYEGPILAERAHVADLARQVRLRARGGSGGDRTPTLAVRVGERMRARGVDPDANAWDAWRSPDGGRWTVVLTFAAGGRQRQASWHFDLVSRTVDAVDDEARWLSEEESTGTGPNPANPVAAQRPTTVYDVEAEGGVTSATAVTPVTPAGRAPDEPVDLMTAMRERSTVRGRRSGGRRKAPSPTELPGAGRTPDDALPLEALAYDPASDGPPPPAHVHPYDDPDVTLAHGPAAAAAAVAAVGLPAAGSVDEAPQDAPAGSPDVRDDQRQPQDIDDDPPGSQVEAATEVGPVADEENAGGAPAPSPASQPATQAGAPDRGAPRKSGRASVPSWDDIMFGARRD